MQMYRLSMILQNNLEIFLGIRTKEHILQRYEISSMPHVLCSFVLTCLKNVLIQVEWLWTDKGAVSKNVYAVGTCIEVFFYIPIYGDGLLFSVVFYILLDGIYQFPVLVWEGVRGTFGQHVIVRFGDADVEGTFAGLCSDVFHDGEVYFELHDVFHFLGSLAAFVGGLHRDVGGVQLCGKRHCLGYEWNFQELG